MCGIAGIIQANTDKYSIHHLKKMTDALAHRGPDGEGLWQNDNSTVQLGHRRLSIIDLSKAAAQPMHFIPSSSKRWAEGNHYTLIHNGEIYNYIEIRRELEKEGYSFHTQSDTEVILAAYDFWYDECVEHFDGMFAFAIWDEKEQELFAARDRFGEKPFFYYFNKEEFVFASEMKSLWAAGKERKANLQMLFNYITIGYVDNPERPEETFFENIFKLPPASRLYYKPSTGELTIEKYWDIDTNSRNKKISDTEAIEQFQNLFATSVKRRLRSDVSLGTSLSGGLDSSSIVAAISGLPSPDSRLQTFTASFPGFEKDELPFSGKIASQFGLPQHISAVTDQSLIDNWENFLYHQEEPVGSSSAFAQYKVFELAKQHNVTVLLDGQGADETLAGYHKYYKWYWQELFQKRKLMHSGEITAARKIGIEEKFGFKNIIASLLPDLASVILEQQYLAYALQQEDLTREFVKLQSKEAYYTTPALNNLNSLLYFNTCVHGLEELLRYADRNSMAHGREVRLPFLSHELVEFVFTLPSHFKIREGWTKWLLRQSMKQQLPPEIVWRKDKIGFEPPQKKWMQNPVLHEMIQEARKKLVKERILRPGVIAKPLQPAGAYEAEAKDWRYLAAAAII
ncbi:MAG: asparagine synthase (glutamine-hydrolyzing) [Chitinophagaceae bacterium]